MARKGFGQSEAGAAAVEFALVLPLLLVLLFGIIEFGFVIYNKAMLTNASREGARAGIVYRTDTSERAGAIADTVDAYLENHLVTFGGTGGYEVETSPDPGTLASGQFLRVTVTYPYQFLFLPNFVVSLAGTVDLKAVTTMRVE
jgi:Flp pilus assembly protein TadG